MSAPTDQRDSETGSENFCRCNSTCSTKAGRKRHGCPCKTAGRFCGELCTCSRRKLCKNREAAALQAQGWENIQGPANQENNGLTEEQERDMENRRVKEFINTLDEALAKKLAIRSLQKGVGSMDYIDTLLIMEDPEDETAEHAPPTPTVSSSEPSMPVPLTPVISTAFSLSQSSISSESSSFAPPPTAVLVRRSTEPLPEWCKCGHCRSMPQEIENRCCKSSNCVSLSRRFTKLCLDRDFLQLSIKSTCDIRNDRQDNSGKAFRKAAYRHYIIEEYGYLGKHKRKVCPSCCVWKIREHFPSSTGVYMGFRAR